jgi:protein-disulfide isomerase/uncharacterized membrane protein
MLSLLAAGISSLLLQKHITGKAGISLFEAGCEVGGDTGNVSCAKVLQSPYAVWPHVRGNENAAAIRKKVPVAFLGLIYYLVLAVWFIGVGLPDASRRWVLFLPGLLVAAGVASSVYFLFVMFAKLDQWCLWCLVTHVLNFGIAVCLVWMWRIVKRSPVANVARGAAAPHNRTPPAQATAPIRSAHPSGRLVFVTLLAMSLVVFGQRYALSSAIAKMMTEASERGLAQCMQGIKRLRGDPDRLVKLWQIGDPQSVPIRPDDPVRQKGSADLPYWNLVVFSDFACPYCKAMASYLDEKVLPLFAGQIRIIFKHFPLDGACNKQVNKTGGHARACEAAGLAESARVQRGNEGFWKAHDALFARQAPNELLAKLDVAEVIAALGLDPKQTHAEMKSRAITERINEDVTLARNSGVTATPWLILNDKVVDGIAANDLNFWDRMADRYWAQAGVPRPASTIPKKPTSSSPSPTTSR